MIRYEAHPWGRRCYVFGRRLHHAPPALLVAVVSYRLRRRRVAFAALIVAAHDARDFPWTDNHNHAPRRTRARAHHLR